MKKWIRPIVIILLISLIIMNVALLKNNYKLNNTIESGKNYVIGFTTRFLPKDLILPILTKEYIDINELYEIVAYVDITQSYVIRFLGFNKYPDINSFLHGTQKEVKKLIELMESNAKRDEINKKLKLIIDMQNNIVEAYHDYNY